MGLAIRAEGLGKKYIIGHRRDNTLRDAAASVIRSLIGLGSGSDTEEFWALRDVSFEIGEGDRIGIVGRNGAGKSTLLKLIGRVTDPSEGCIRIRGRITSLLEVGTGFHQELTGRENIYLNGAILGMTRTEIRKKFDEMVEFAEVEKFLDVPVKRYSSGMYVRLAFAVAAHLASDILLIDEVLAVGDVQFQKKCLGKMEDAGKEGRTILFVSHNMSSVARLCNKGILLVKGQTGGVCGLQEVIESYMGAARTGEVVFKPGCALKRACIRQLDEAIEIVAEYKTDFKIGLPNLGFVISDNNGTPVCGANLLTDPPENELPLRDSGTVRVMLDYPKLLNGTYRLSLWFGDGITDFFWERDCLAFDVFNMVRCRQWPASEVGPVRPVCRWYFE